MRSRAALWALAAAFFMLLVASPTISAPAAGRRTRIGIFMGGHQNTVALGRALGVRYERLILAVNGSDDRQLASIKAAEAAGFRLNVQFNNLAPSTASRARSGPVTDDAIYERTLAADLDATHPYLVTIQNEEDGLQFWSGTPQDYLHELADAVRVAHARGYEISNGGITAAGVMLAYWHHLWITGQHAAADAFAQSSLGPGAFPRRSIASDIPNSAYPDRPILARTVLMRNKLARVETLIAGYRATGVDYVNFHWYEGGPDDLRAVATWLSQATGLPAICNEMGQYSNNPDTVAALLGMSQSLHMAYVMWFAIDGNGPAVGLADQGGALRANGEAFRDFVDAHR
jgi:hypothetical protein